MDNDLRPQSALINLIAAEFVRLDDVLHQHEVTGIDYPSVTVNGAEIEVLKGRQDPTP